MSANCPIPDELRKLSEAATAGPWSACGGGDCSCVTIMCADHPICKVTRGQWGDDFPSVRLVGPSLDLKAEPYMEQITYGEVDEKVAAANTKFIAAAVNYIREALGQEARSGPSSGPSDGWLDV
jgi:hypothetical protein